MKNWLLITNAAALITFAFLPLRANSFVGFEPSQISSPEQQSADSPPIACNLFALDKAQRKRQEELWNRLIPARKGIRELTDGYAIGITSSAENLLATAELISLERACCPFFRFELEVRGNDELMWLKLTGGEGVKAFLKTALKER